MSLPLVARDPREAPPQPETSFPIHVVHELVLALGKAIRAHQLYLRNNPTYLRTLDLTRAAFATVWDYTSELAFEVTETELRWEEHAVVSEPDKASDSLPWILYKDGIREIRILKDFELHELVGFLDIIQRVRKATNEQDDLLTMLWESEFVYLQAKYIDRQHEEGEAIERPMTPAERPLAVKPSEELLATEQASIVNVDDFDSTLYFLDEQEIEYLREEIRKEFASDLSRNVVSMLLDIFEQQQNPSVRSEICDILASLTLRHLSAGQLRTVAFTLREAAVCAERAPGLGVAERERLIALGDGLSSPEAVTQLLQLLEDDPELPPREDLDELFTQLRAAALETVLARLGTLQKPRLRMLLEAAAERLAQANTPELVRLIRSPSPKVALEAIRRSAALMTPAAVAPLAHVLHDADVRLRGAAVHALAAIGSTGALQALEQALVDEEREIRVAAARAIGAKAHRPSFQRVEAVTRGKAIRDADLTEKIAFFETYGLLSGDEGIPFLDSLLNGRSVFGRREEPELRACAAMALGKIGSDAAYAVLNKAAGDREVLVRNAVSRALRGTAA